jgi:hypothetical protein
MESTNTPPTALPPTEPHPPFRPQPPQQPQFQAPQQPQFQPPQQPQFQPPQQPFQPPQAPQQPFQPPQAQPEALFPPPRPIMSEANEQSRPTPSPADPVFALALLALGFCFWEWKVLGPFTSGIGATLFFLLVLISSFIYLQVRGVRQNTKSLLMLLLAVAGSLPFVLNGARDINFFLLPLEACACLLWFMYSCRTSISNKLSGLFAADLLNQVLIVPFANFGRIFVQPFSQMTGRRKVLFPLLLALCGLIICIPVFSIVVWLLALSDEGFKLFTESITTYFAFDDVMRYIFEFIFGIPIAAYLFGAVFGNALKLRSSHISSEGSLRVFNTAHILPRALLYAPLVLFVLLYIIYFITMGSYLFSGLQGKLPTAYTYAEYARHGFFELCGVATINLCILAGIWLLAKRGIREYPPALRVLSALLTLLTCLLIVTAASKMLLYIQTYGLTPLRVYTTWFMALMLLSFLALLIWHVKPYNVARPVIILATVFTLGLGFANTNGFIANYNVDRYLSAQTELIDVDTLIYLSDPALPALYRLQDATSDPALLADVENAIDTIENAPLIADGQYNTQSPWYRWNLQTHLAALKNGE